ncbi:PLP-dependent transferase [Decorospora gaudefroyi]|uniref:PLP-dependent transferase n=1 Tax=Decorospora gaudefroyi TaxID=184978 RepID=A0A6A5KH39_9PLEO|nr:PLP-dependent transferase [Decorospora gaudefroyi]
MRKKEYPMLKGLTYLDHGGTTLAPKSLLKSFCNEMQNTLLVNPHSDVSNPSASAVIIEETRLEVLKMFNADPEHFDIVFTANATAAIKLVTEGFTGNEEGFDYFYHRNSHTSLVGVRELARLSHCFASNEELEDWLTHGMDGFSEEFGSPRPTLFAYPGQSNMNGERLPLDWAGKLRFSLRHPKTYTLLDAAAFVSTSPLDLSDHLFAPDFVALSFYKIFGFPDLGALIVRKAAGHVFDKRKYFGGGTTEMTTCIGEAWVARRQSNLHSRLEDGTQAIRSILALKCAIETHRELFGGLGEVSKHTSWLAKALHARLTSLKHFNDAPVCHPYQSPDSTYGDPKTQGATIAFNICKSDSTYIGPWRVGALLRAKTIHVRTGSLCNPAGVASALDMKAEWLRRAFEGGFRCNTAADILEGKPVGVVRVTLGAMSTMNDVDALVDCLRQHFAEKKGDLNTDVGGQVEKIDSVGDPREPSAVAEHLEYRITESATSDKDPPAQTSDTLSSWLSLRKIWGHCLFAED